MAKRARRWLVAGALAAAAGGAAAEDCGLTPAEVFRKVAPSTVEVLTLAVDPFAARDRTRGGLGTGVSLGGDLVATNHHVVLDARQIVVATDEALLEAQLVGADPLMDLAVLRAPGLSQLAPPIELAPDDALEVGQPAHVVGYPLGVGESISTGVVSGVGRLLRRNTWSWLSPFVQTDAAVSGGNSGGPLADACGRMVGMVTLRTGHPEAENLGFAIPAATLRALLPELAATGKVARPWHGLYGQMVNPAIMLMLGAPPEALTAIRGFLVETVEPGSAADKAGIRGGTLPVTWGSREIILGGDIITAVDGTPILTLAAATDAVRGLEIGRTVKVTLLRDGRPMEVKALLEERPQLPQDLEALRRD